LPTVLLSGASTVLGFVIASPVGSSAPSTLAVCATLLNVCAGHAAKLRQKFKYAFFPFETPRRR
jgi:hypothetical protein